LPPPAEAALVAAGFFLGAIVGSYLATLLVRWPERISASRGRSRCDQCGRSLGALELVPIFSYFLARGRCRHCGGRIDRRHLAIEAGAALIGLTAILAHSMPVAVATALFGWWLFLLAALDIEYHWLPDRLTLPLIPAGLLAGWIGIGPNLESRLIGAAAAFLALVTIAFLYRRLRGREGLGGGDPKLFGAIGAWLGWQQLPSVLLGAALIGFAVIFLMYLRGRAIAATDRLPFGTLMALAAWPIWLVIGA
jgi:leader peptidase (prepilin peptidase)/N-methyltransferase